MKKFKKIVIPDTNVLIHNPDEVNGLQENGEALFVMPWKVQLELDGLKNRGDIGWDARRAIRLVEENQLAGNPNFMFYQQQEWEGLHFSGKDQGLGDPIILATINHALANMPECQEAEEIQIISADVNFRIWARESFRGNKKVAILSYDKDETDVLHYAPHSEVSISEKFREDDRYRFDSKEIELFENDGIIIHVNRKGNKFPLMAIKKGEYLYTVDNGISAYGIKPMVLNGDGYNWSQTHALAQLLDPSITLSFLLGGAGTGKTLLALAAAIEQRKIYRNIFVSRPMVHLEDQDNMGYLPGDVREKMGPWLKPIYQNLDFLDKVNEPMAEENEEVVDEDKKGKKDKKTKEKLTLINTMRARRKIDIEPLDYIRGTTFLQNLLIIDEAQNLTPHQIKTIITRIGKGSKLIMTGDLSQIDVRRKLNARSSGLNYAANNLRGHPIVGLSIFKESLRSELAQLALERL